ncbi:CDP-glycerol glycerophosphotransferase family protein [Microbacterium oleivorans]|uniref:CDP-glycerol glycerophosphotransferase family protein n=1 Tax=Microbacterium oleivorans TaxID=273677 RepID=UPI000767483A|nr:CDP-glycerol glycerophosphotransferase family protein [Microbacterium oleivorans]
MGSFSFSSGNGAQVVRLPLHVLGLVATRLVPRSKDLWVFGSAVGVGEGAWALWHVAVAHGERAVWLTGSQRDADAARSAGIRSAPKRSLRGFWLTARARVVVITHGAGDVNRYATSGAFLVQLWHGIPLKRLGLDSPVTARAPLPLPGLARLLAYAYARTQRRIRLLPAASHLVRGRLESAFGLGHDRIVVTGEPRVDVLSAGPTESEARAVVESLVGSVAGARLVLYAPTWRDGDRDPAVPTAAEWTAIRVGLEEAGAVLVIRSHPLGAGDYVPPSGDDRIRLLGADLLPDVTPVLPAFEVLVTDYSSLVFDTALIPLPVVYFAPDEEKYTAERGFYGRYRDVAGLDVARDWRGVMQQLDQVLGAESEYARRVERAKELSRRVHAFRDGRNAERVYRAIRRGLDASRSTRGRQ